MCPQAALNLPLRLDAAVLGTRRLGLRFRLRSCLSLLAHLPDGLRATRKPREWNRKEGEVLFFLNDPDPTDESKKMDTVAGIMKASSIDPFTLLTRDELREFIGYGPYPEDEPEEEAVT